MNVELLKKYSKLVTKADIKSLMNDPQLDLPHEEYKKIKRTELNERIKSLKKVYLDQKYWINIRKNIFDEPNKEIVYYNIFNKLKQLVEEKKIVCPISQIGFFELLKQKYSRKKTAQMIDILSDGIGTNHLNEIKKAELFNLIHKEFKNSTLVHDFVWNKVICILGEPEIHIKTKNDQGNLMSNTLYSIFYETDFQFLVSNEGMFSNDTTVVNWLSNMLNQKKIYSQENHSFKEIQFKELLSSLYTLSELIKLEVEFNYEKFEILKSNKEIINIIPSLKIFSSIHSVYLIDNKRKYKPNDFDDIEHSCIALGYSDYFFTENSLAHLLKNNPLNFDKEFNTVIESDPNIVLEILNQIN